jgi:hypothetical protein
MPRIVLRAFGAAALLGLAACQNYGAGGYGPAGPTGSGIEQGMESGALTPSEARRVDQILTGGS